MAGRREVGREARAKNANFFCSLRIDSQKPEHQASSKAVMDGQTQAGEGLLPSPEHEDLKGYGLPG